MFDQVFQTRQGGKREEEQVGLKWLGGKYRGQGIHQNQIESPLTKGSVEEIVL